MGKTTSLLPVAPTSAPQIGSHLMRRKPARLGSGPRTGRSTSVDPLAASPKCVGGQSATLETTSSSSRDGEGARARPLAERAGPAPSNGTLDGRAEARRNAMKLTRLLPSVLIGAIAVSVSSSPERSKETTPSRSLRPARRPFPRRAPTPSPTPTPTPPRPRRTRRPPPAPNPTPPPPPTPLPR